MIWAKTDAGRLEMQSRLHVRERPRRNLLLLIDGVRSQESLLAGLLGISAADFEALRQLELIEVVSSAGAAALPTPTLTATAAATTTTTSASGPAQPSVAAATGPTAGLVAPARPMVGPLPEADPRPAAAPAAAEALDYAQFTAELTRLISTHLGLRGFVLTLAVEKASTIEELRDVAQRVLDLIRQRKGDAVATEARKTLYGS